MAQTRWRRHGCPPVRVRRRAGARGSKVAGPVVSIRSAEQLRLRREGPAGGIFPSNWLPKQHGEGAPGPLHPATFMHVPVLHRLTRDTP